MRVLDPDSPDRPDCAPSSNAVVDAERTALDSCRDLLESCYHEAQTLYEGMDDSPLVAVLGNELAGKVRRIAQQKHAARGVLVTLSVFKVYNPNQDIRCNKAEHPGGFAGRTIDEGATVPFLLSKTLPRSVQTHWLSQTFSFQNVCWAREMTLRTQPRWLGPTLIDVVNTLEETEGSLQATKARAMATLILYILIDIRNHSEVLLTKPKGLVIDRVIYLLDRHFRFGYKANSPRLPQIAVYSMYECLIDSMARYAGLSLDPLARMRAADRKARTVGDIVLRKEARPIEAVETKLGVPVGVTVVSEAIEKVRTASVERYLILSTGNIAEDEREAVTRLCLDFRNSNGCEIIVNGLLETIGYYLRLLPDTNGFISKYAERVEKDVDLDYEHRIAWNAICAELTGP